jgi:vancomycin resistance protein YoaR
MKGRWRIYFLLAVSALLTGVAIYELRPFRVRMASTVTDLSERTPAQRRNIEKTGEFLSDLVLQSGEDFSLNAHAGPYTLERGFLPERSFLGKSVADSPGGGVCQVASTLYNAALQAGLRILERIPHSQEVHSVPKGRDATLAYGVAD